MRNVLASATQATCPLKDLALRDNAGEERLRMRLYEISFFLCFTTISEWFNIGQYEKEGPWAVQLVKSEGSWLRTKLS